MGRVFNTAGPCRADMHYMLDPAERLPGVQQIANPIYREVIPRALAFGVQQTVPYEQAWYVREDGTLDFPRLLDGFVELWTEHSEVLLPHTPYPEAAPQLILMAFLQRVINAGGTIDREYAEGRGRIDRLVRWPHPDGLQREAMELKVWRPRKADPLARGLEQLSSYPDRLGLERGWLVIFDRRRQELPPDWEATRERHQQGPHRIDVLRA